MRNLPVSPSSSRVQGVCAGSYFSPSNLKWFHLPIFSSMAKRETTCESFPGVRLHSGVESCVCEGFRGSAVPASCEPKQPGAGYNRSALNLGCRLSYSPLHSDWTWATHSFNPINPPFSRAFKRINTGDENASAIARPSLFNRRIPAELSPNNWAGFDLCNDIQHNLHCSILYIPYLFIDVLCIIVYSTYCHVYIHFNSVVFQVRWQIWPRGLS